MTITTQAIAQRAQILHEMGITTWVLKTQKTAPIGALYYDRTQIPTVHFAIDKMDKALDNSSVPPDTVQDTPQNTTAAPDPQNTIRVLDETSAQQIQHNTNFCMPFVEVRANLESFVLYGIAYQGWVLLADDAMMDANMRSVWQALCQKLQHNQNTIVLQARYPWAENTHPQYQNWMQGVHVLSGFLFRLCAMQNPPKIAVLTALSSGIELGELCNHIQQTPTLAQMTTDNQAKKDFWQQLHQNNLI